MADAAVVMPVEVTVDPSPFQAAMNKINAAAKTAGASLEKNFLAAGKGMKNMAESVLNLHHVVELLAGAALVEFIKKTVEVGDQIAKTSTRLGISGEEFQKLSYAARLAGVEQEDFTKALEQFNKRMGDFSGNVTQSMKALGQLGLTMADLKGKTPDEQLRLVADGFQKIQDPALRAALAADLFGKSGTKLLNVLTTGGSGLRALGEEAAKFGLILSNDTLKKAEEANDEFERIGKALKVAGVNIAVGFLPVIEDVRRAFTSQQFQDGIRATSAALAEFIRWMVDNKDTIIIVSTTLAGIKLGTSFGGAFGRQGAAIGAVTGALTGFIAGAELARDADKKLTDQLDHEPTKITVNKAVNPIDPAVTEAIDNLIFQTRVIKGDFDKLAEGFPAAAHGLKQFGQSADESRVSAEQLSPQLRKLNEAQLDFKRAQLTQDSLTPLQEYEQRIMRINQAFADGAKNPEAYAQAMKKAADQAGVSWNIAGASIAGSFATIAGSFGQSNSKMAVAAKAFAIVQAVISTYTGMAKALELPFPANLAAVAATAAQGFAFVASIKSQAVPKFAQGGSFRVGGVGGIDSQRVAMDVTPGEIVNVHKRDPGRGGSASPTFVFQIDARNADPSAAAAFRAAVPSLIANAVAESERRILRNNRNTPGYFRS